MLNNMNEKTDMLFINSYNKLIRQREFNENAQLSEKRKSIIEMIKKEKERNINSNVILGLIISCTTIILYVYHYI